MGDILLIGNGINESESLGKYLTNVSAMDDAKIQLFGKIIVNTLIIKVSLFDVVDLKDYVVNVSHHLFFECIYVKILPVILFVKS